MITILDFLEIPAANRKTNYTRTIRDQHYNQRDKSATSVAGTWTRQNPYYYLSTVNQLFFINEWQGWATGGMHYNEIRRTADGDKTWETFTGPVPEGNYSRCHDRMGRYQQQPLVGISSR